MQIVQRSGNDENRIVTAMLLDPAVLGRVADRWRIGGLFASPWANYVGQWAVDHWAAYGAAPGRAIAAYYETWAETNADRESAALVERYLANLSAQYESGPEINAPYVIDLAGKYFNKIAARKLIEQMQADIDTGGDPMARVTETQRIELGKDEAVDMFRDQALLESVFAQPTESIVKYPAPMDRFFGDNLGRDQFIAFMGPEKRGKTWWLIDLAYRAALQRRKVAFFEVGDMSLNQIVRRFGIRAARLPRKPNDIWIPKSFARAAVSVTDEVSEDEDGKGKWRNDPNKPEKCWDLQRERRYFPAGLDLGTCRAAFDEFMQRRAKSNDLLFKLSVHSNDSVNVGDIANKLRDWGRDGWTPDVVVIDYADILAPPAGGLEERDGINKTWKQLRALSQDFHCLVATATQADAESYDATTMKLRNFSGDKRKYGHVTATYAINQTPKEKKLGIQRLTYQVCREEDWSVGDSIAVAGCIPLGNPAVFASF